MSTAFGISEMDDMPNTVCSDVKMGLAGMLSERLAGTRPARETLKLTEFSRACVDVRLRTSWDGVKVTPLIVGRVIVVLWLPIAFRVISESVVMFEAICFIAGATSAEEKKLTMTKVQPITAVHHVQVQGQHTM